MIKRIAHASLLAILPGVALAAPLVPAPPTAQQIPVIDDYYGTRITDPYRWMENRSDPRFVVWLKAQDSYARAILADIPGLDRLQARIAAHGGLADKLMSLQSAGGTLFYLKRPAGEEVFKLFARDGGGTERLLLDPSAFAGAATHGAIDYYQASPDGRHIAVSVSTGGSENGTLHVLETGSGQQLGDTIDRVEQGNPMWLPDGSGFFYNRYVAVPAGAPETEKYLNSRAMLHRLGTPASADVALVGTGVAGSPPLGPVEMPYVLTSPVSRWAVLLLIHGATPAYDVYVAPLDQASRPGAPWRQIAGIADQVTGATAVGDRLYLLTHKEAARYKIVAIDAARGDLAHATTVVAPGPRVIQSMTLAQDALYLRDLDAGIGKIRRVDLATDRVSELPAATGQSVLDVTSDPRTPGALFETSAWLAPNAYYASRGTGLTPLALGHGPVDDTSAYVSEEVTAKSGDGTMIPLSILHRRDLQRDGRNPVWLTAYGAYGYSITPTLMANFLPFLEDGGVLAIAHVRGGGEFGEDWHMAGFQKTKPNTYTDLIAAAEYLDAQHYGSPATTAIQGGSAGGITVGMATTARPDLFRVVFNDVGDNNTLRAENGTDGESNALEYGSVKTRAGFEALRAVDATQHVRAGTPYPAVFLTTGYNDPRVAPFQPGKMTARLQVATSSGRPVVLRVDFDAGHGIGSTRSQRERQYAEQFGFFYWQIGRPAFQPSPRK